MILDDYLRKTPTSAQWSQRARKSMPDGVTVDTRVFNPYSLYVARASGVHKTDVDGNVLLDFFGGHGAMVLGHCHPRVTAAVTEAMARGVQYAACHPLEVGWAERITRHIPGAAKVRFTGSGTESTMLAMRLARAHTGRERIVRVATHYHGWHDFATSGYNAQFDGSPAPGVLGEVAAKTLLVPPNDIAALEQAFAQHGASIAGVIVEPLGSHFGLVPVADAYLQRCADLARANGALFILDEVVSGFRIAPGGIQSLLGLRPDLTCLGKAATGGMPGGAVAGSEDVMGMLQSSLPRKVLHQGTFTGNPVTAAAAIAAIDEIVERDVCTHINALGDYARESLNDMFDRKGVRWLAYGRYSGLHLMPGLSPRGSDPFAITRGEVAKPSAELAAALRMGLILEGVDIGGRGTVFLAWPHQREHVDQLVAAMERVLERLGKEGLLDPHDLAQATPA